VLVVKSCNRCGRYLLIDIENETNTLSFSNHCDSTAPCKHSTFSSYRIKESHRELPQYIRKKLIGNFIKTYYGYQLECKSCKKFFVNAPLNPMRSSTQHREDSLRRRAIEVLVDKLLDREWIYHKFRKEKGIEFDKHIWNKFDRKCFNCGKELKSCNDMDLDHTMPLVALWPLDETATCLCKKCNSEKSDKFPIEFYKKNQLEKLSKITNIRSDIIFSRKINEKVLNQLIRNIQWFFDEFLNNKDYQKVRKGKRTSDLIFYSIQQQIRKSKIDVDLIRVYKEKKGKYPNSITINKE